jgi:predicted RNA-binding protein with TRAM domain
MELSDDLLCVFTARVEEADDSYVIELPTKEVELGSVGPGGTYRLGMFESAGGSQQESDTATGSEEGQVQGPPVDEGEQRTVEVEDIGEQGDGIARVERGYVIIVPGTELHERVTIRITKVRENLAFGEVVKRHDHYE